MTESGLNKGVVLSLQSLNKETLKNIARANISTEVFQELQHRFTRDNVQTMTDLILGLPSETYDTFVDGVSTVIENGQYNRIQFNNLSLLPNADMGNPDYHKRFGFDIVETEIVNIHGVLSYRGEIPETQLLVVGTNTMPRPEWIKTRAFCWMTALLVFDKLLQIPFIAIREQYPTIKFRELLEIFATKNPNYPILSEIYSFFVNKAIDIQNGGAEYCESKEYLNVWWPADELTLIKLVRENKLSGFYNESEQILNDFLHKKNIYGFEDMLKESIKLNNALLKMPFQNEDMDVDLSYNIWEVYQAVIKGLPSQLERGQYTYRIDRKTKKWNSWETWYQEVIWYENKKGAYLYTCKLYSTPLAVAALHFSDIRPAV